MTLVLLAASLAILGLAAPRMDTNAAEQAVPGREVPTFQVDPSWPTIPSKWSLGPVSGLTVDSNDHVWVITRPREVVRPVEGKPPALPIMEFDAASNFIQGWGGSGQGKVRGWLLAHIGVQSWFRAISGGSLRAVHRPHFSARIGQCPPVCNNGVGHMSNTELMDMSKAEPVRRLEVFTGAGAIWPAPMLER